MFGITYHRLADEHGNEYSAPVDKAIPDGHTVLEGKPATTTDGQPLPVKEHDTLAANVAASLKGQALQAALEAAGLSTEGTADEKRARLAEHAEPAEVTEAEANANTGQEQSE